MMKMKRMTWLLTAIAGLLTASCSNDVPVQETEGNELITFTVKPDPGVKTRAAASMVPTGKKLRYIMEVYDVAGTAMTLNSRTVQAVADETTPVTFTWQRPQGSTYKAVFWADLTLQATENDDAYYDTSSGLDNITFVSSNTNNFDGEAFFGSVDISSATSATESVTLTHAVSLVSLKTTQPLTGYGSVKVTYGDAGGANAPVSSFNAVNGTAGTTGATVEKVNTVNSGTSATPSSPYDFHTFYLFAPTDTKGLINMKVTMCSDAAGTTPQQSTNIPNVPLRANYKTNVTGNFAQATDAFSISCTNSWRAELGLPSVWNGIVPAGNSAGSAFSGGTGADVDNAYLISSAADLAQLAADVNAGCDYASKFFKLTTDIDLDNHEWTPAGVYIGYNDASNKAFKGSFDGEHHEVMKLTVNSNVEKCSIGLFGYVDNGSIQNIHVSGTVSNTYATGISNAGGIVGYLNKSPIKACSFDGSVSNSSNEGKAAGICGSTSGMSSTIFGCINRGAITSGHLAGGITNWCQTLIMVCYNEGTITAADIAAGIASDMSDASGDVKGCYNIGTIAGAAATKEAIAHHGGGGGSITECYSLNKISASHGGEVQFSELTWPDGTKTDDSSSNNLWRVDANPDGTYKYDSSTSWKYHECKIWKSVGSWNGGSPVYPKLWWEE